MEEMRQAQERREKAESERDAAVKRLHKAGSSCRDIARALSASRGSIKRTMERLGLSDPEPVRLTERRLSDKRKHWRRKVASHG